MIHAWLFVDGLRGPILERTDNSPNFHARAILAVLFYYKIHAADVMRFLGGTYMGEHRDVDAIVIKLNLHDIDYWLISQYIQVTTVGYPNHFVAKTSRENYLRHWRKGKHTSVDINMVDVLSTMAKEHQNWYNVPLPCYSIR